MSSAGPNLGILPLAVVFLCDVLAYVFFDEAGYAPTDLDVLFYFLLEIILIS